MNHELEPLPDEIKDLIEAARVDEEPAASIKDRARARLELAMQSEPTLLSEPALLSQPATSREPAPSSEPGRSSEPDAPHPQKPAPIERATGRGSSSIRRIAIPILALAAGIALGFFIHGRRHEGVTAQGGPAPRTYVPRSDGIKPLGAFASNGEELLDDATSALMKDDPEAAIAKLEEHAQKHPQGPLTELREALYVEALARSGKTKLARERGARFFESYPKSMLGPAVKDALGRISDD